ASFGAAGALLINLVYRQLTWQILRDSLLSTLKLCGMGFWILIGANIYLNIFNYLGSQALLTELLLNVPGGTTGVLITMMLIVLLLGTVMDDWEISMLFTPLFLPIIAVLGLDKMWFGVRFIVNIQLADLARPFGFVRFWIQGILPKDVHMGQVHGSVGPFIGMPLLGLILI